MYFVGIIMFPLAELYLGLEMKLAEKVGSAINTFTTDTVLPP